nr:MAG TPA: hypothetical protein [Caudoviricetes sp.]
MIVIINNALLMIRLLLHKDLPITKMLIMLFVNL